jgi:hypothetical protein
MKCFQILTTSFFMSIFSKKKKQRIF